MNNSVASVIRGAIDGRENVKQDVKVSHGWSEAETVAQDERRDGLRKDSIYKKLERTRERIEELNEREKVLVEQYREAELAESIRLLQRHKVTSEALARLLMLTEEDVGRILSEKKKEEQNQNERTDQGNEEEGEQTELHRG